MRNPYEVLGIEAGADKEVVKATYRKLALKWHPDRCREAGADAKFKEITAAYHAVLSGKAPPPPSVRPTRPKKKGRPFVPSENDYVRDAAPDEYIDVWERIRREDQEWEEAKQKNSNWKASEWAYL